MADRSRDLNFIIGALDRSEKAFAKVAAKIDRLERRVDRLDGKRVEVDVDVDTKEPERSLSRLAQRVQEASKPVRLTQRALATLAASAAAVAPAALAAGAAVGAFGAVAAPSVIKVATAFQDAGAGLDTLNARQLESAGLVQGLIDNYKALSEAAEPQALQAFNNAIVTGNTLLRQFEPAIDAGGDALVAFTARANAEFSNPQWEQFFTFLGTEAPAAARDLSDALFSTLDTAAALTQALAPLASVTIPLVGGVASLAGSVASAHPELVQMAVVAVTLRGVLSAARTGVAALSSSFLSLSASSGTAAAAMTLFGRAAAVGGLVLLVQRFADARLEAERFADTVVARGTDVTSQIVAVQDELNRQHEIMTKGFTILDTYYSNDQAKEAADRADVLTGRIAALQAQRKADAEAARLQQDVQGSVNEALRDAADTTKTFEERLEASKRALDALFTPTIDVWNATISLKRGYDELITAMDKGNVSLSGNSEASLDLQSAFTQQLTTVTQLRDAIRNKTGSDHLARQAVEQQLPILYAMAGRNRDARTAVDALAISTGNATGKTNVSREAFFRAARQMGITRGRAERLWREYKKIPKNVRTRVTMPGGERAIDTARRLRQAIRNIPTRRVVDVLVRRFEQPGFGSSDRGSGGSDLDSLLNPGRAAGGSVLAGRTYLVGEKGPELLTMGARNGTVIPNNEIAAAAGPGDTIVHVYLGDNPVEQVVKRVVVERDRGIKRRVLAGAGGAR